MNFLFKLTKGRSYNRHCFGRGFPACRACCFLLSNPRIVTLRTVHYSSTVGNISGEYCRHCQSNSESPCVEFREIFQRLNCGLWEKLAQPSWRIRGLWSRNLETILVAYLEYAPNCVGMLFERVFYPLWTVYLLKMLKLPLQRPFNARLTSMPASKVG